VEPVSTPPLIRGVTQKQTEQSTNINKTGYRHESKSTPNNLIFNKASITMPSPLLACKYDFSSPATKSGMGL